MNTDVAIVGAGPVGLDLANRLAMRGVAIRVLEARQERGRHSRSIGIHAPSLGLLEETGVAQSLRRAGLFIRTGHAYSGPDPIGTLDLGQAPALALPQHRTEEILETRLQELAPSALRRGVAVERLIPHQDRVVLETSAGTVTAWFVVGCDGQNSTTRTDLGIPFRGGPYRDTYAMGDFEDNTDFGSDAAIFLTSRGMVESFPLPERTRRWVVYSLQPQEDPSWLTDQVARRTGMQPDPATNSMMSIFGVYRLLAETMARGRVLLAGDAAHVVSPIGGQGMNVGWLDGRDAAETLLRALNGQDYSPLLAAYSERRRRIARKAARRAEFNMAMGRPGLTAPLKRAAARVILRPPLKKFFVSRFTMQGLE